MEAAGHAAQAAVGHMESSGLASALQDLVSNVWGTNLAGHEPAERGDTTRSLGVQCSENIRELAIRRALGDDLVADEDRWAIEGLTISTRRGSLSLSLAGRQASLMKVPYEQGRQPRWDRFPDWDTESQIRNEIAAANARVLNAGDLTHEHQAELSFADDPEPGLVQRFMLVWAGDPDGLTAAWLTVPVTWPIHFAARVQLWWDESQGDEPRVRRRDSPDGPTYDRRPVADPKVTLKPRPAAERG